MMYIEHVELRSKKNMNLNMLKSIKRMLQKNVDEEGVKSLASNIRVPTYNL